MTDERDPAGEDLQVDEDRPQAPLGHTVETSVEEIIAGLVEDEDAPVRRVELARVVAATYRRHSGPLPSPEQMAEYDVLIPNGADRIMRQAEKEQEFRHAAHARQQALVESVVANDHDVAKRGQRFALLISLAVLILGGLFLYAGFAKTGAAMVGAVVIGLAAVFVDTRRRESSRRVSTDLMAPSDDAEHEPDERP